MAKVMTDKELKEEVLSIADYLGCNGPELWSEMEKLIDKYTEGKIEEAVDDALWHNNVGSE